MAFLKKISCTIKNAIKYLHKAQTPGGGWIGSWGICITYATQFALESLSLVGETYETSPHSRRACDFLLKKQRADGGWGESYKVCVFFLVGSDFGESHFLLQSLVSWVLGWNMRIRKLYRRVGQLCPSCMRNILILNLSKREFNWLCQDNDL